METNIRLQTAKELNILRDITLKTSRIGGHIAEVGVYYGYSAEAIARVMSSAKILYLFDTFDGFHDLREEEKKLDTYFDFSNSYEYVKGLNLPNVEIVKGYFPKTAKDLIDDKTFSLVHIDVDSYQSTLNCLQYFYGKVNPGGAIIIHDYLQKDLKVKEAVDLFTRDKIIVYTSSDSTQGIIWK